MCSLKILNTLIGGSMRHYILSLVYTAPDWSRSVSGYKSTSCVSGCLRKWTDLDWTHIEMWIRIWIRIRIQIQISCVYTTLSGLNPDTDLDQVVLCKHSFRDSWHANRISDASCCCNHHQWQQTDWQQYSISSPYIKADQVCGQKHGYATSALYWSQAGEASCNNYTQYVWWN